MKKYQIVYIILVLLIEISLVDALKEKAMSLSSVIIISLILLISVVYTIKSDRLTA